MNKLIYVCLFIGLMACSNESSTETAKTDSEDFIIKESRRSDGSLASKNSYKNGKRNGQCISYYKDGNAHLVIDYKDNKKHGKAKMFYPNRKLYSVTDYINGEIDGKRITYYKNGEVRSIEVFKKGEPTVGLQEYDINGKAIPTPSLQILEKDARYKNGIYHIQVKMSREVPEIKYWMIAKIGKEDLVIALENDPKNKMIGHLKLPIDERQFIMFKALFRAEYRTFQGNIMVIEKEHNIATN